MTPSLPARAAGGHNGRVLGPSPFESRAAPRVPAQAALAKVGKVGPLRVVNVSEQGTCLEASRGSLSPGKRVPLQLSHPHAGAPVEIAGEVVWCKVSEQTGRPRIGLQFTTVSVEQRTALRRVMAAEAGRTVVDGGDRVVGFAVEADEGRTWHIYDGTATRTAIARRKGAGVELVRRGDGAPEVTSVPALGEALRLVYGLDAPPRLEPPTTSDEAAVPLPPEEPAPPPRPQPPSRPALDLARKAAELAEKAKAETRRANAAHVRRGAAPAKEAAPRPTPRPKAAPEPEREPEPAAPAEPKPLAGSKVMDGGQLAGYVALVRDGVWAVFDEDQDQVAVLSRAEGSFRIFSLAEHDDLERSEFLEAESFPAALGAVFELPNLPRLASAVIKPRSAPLGPPTG